MREHRNDINVKFNSMFFVFRIYFPPIDPRKIVRFSLGTTHIRSSSVPSRTSQLELYRSFRMRIDIGMY